MTEKHPTNGAGHQAPGVWHLCPLPASFSVALREPTPDRPLTSEMLERHEFSSQTFVPVNVGRWLIVVAPHAKAGGPDLAGLKAFIADGRHGVTYKANTWHHGLTTLDEVLRVVSRGDASERAVDIPRGAAPAPSETPIRVKLRSSPRSRSRRSSAGINNCLRSSEWVVEPI